MRLRLTAAVLALSSVLVLAPGASARIYDLGSTGSSVGDFNPTAVNSDGNVAGAKLVAGSGGCGSVVGHAAIWMRGTAGPNVFGGFGAASDKSSVAYDINDSNLVVGSADTNGGCVGRHAFRWAGGPAVDLGLAGQDGNFAAALGVNEGGDVVGFSANGEAGSGCDAEDEGDFAGIADDDCPYPVYWPSSTTVGVVAAHTDDSEWMVRGISDTGRMVGYNYVTNPATGKTWATTGGTADSLTNLIPREHGISPNGTFVVGSSGTTPRFADFTNPAAPAYFDLALPAGATGGLAFAVNDSEQIVGEAAMPGGPRAVVWDGHGATPELLDERRGADEADWVLVRALDISNGGYVVGTGTKGGVPHGYVLGASLVVNDDGDEPDTDTGDGVCDTDAGTAGPQCTLRAAIETVNADAATSRVTIEFGIADGLPARPTITVTSPLPAITKAVSIDGTSQDGTNAPASTPRIVLKGAFSGVNSSASAGLRLTAGSSVVRGLDIVSFPGPGVFVDGPGGDAVVGNWIGVSEVGGTYADAGNGVGVEVSADNVVIGGASAEDRNVISGNGDTKAATDKLKAFDAGGNEAQKAAALRTMVRDLGAGVLIADASSGARITGNYVGVGPNGQPIGDPTQTGGIGNVAGVLVAPADVSQVRNVTIGGAGAAANVVTGNVIGVGVLAAPSAIVDGVQVLGNKIGVNASGVGSKGQFLGNVFGVLVAGGANAVRIGASGSGNAIQGNVVGVFSAGPRPTNLSITGNSIGAGAALSNWAEQMKKSGTLGLGTLNVFGIWLVNTEGATVASNEVTGNFIAVASNGNLVSANAYRDNLIGREVGSDASFGRDMSVDELGSVIGMLHLANGADTIANNRIVGNAIGELAVNTTGATWTGNVVDYNIIGLLCGSCHRVQVGAVGSAPNRYSRNIVGLLFAHRELSSEELQRAKAEYREILREQRDAAVNSDDAGAFASLMRAFSGDDGSSELTEQQLDDLNVSNTHRIENNLIGADASTAKDALSGRGQANELGMWVIGDVTDTTIGRTGGAKWGEGGNVIAHNRQSGVWLGPGTKGHWPRQVKIRSNRIFDNGWNQLFPAVPGMGIDLIDWHHGLKEAAFGPTVNDDLDADDGPNSFQNFPELAGAAPVKGGSRVVGVLASKPRTKYKLEFFASNRCNKFGYGEGEFVVGEKIVKTGPDGTVVFDAKVAGAVKAGQFVTATATEETEAETGLGTSEFSRCAVATATAPKVIVGKKGADTLRGTDGPDVIDGKGGNDRIDGGGGDDILIGGDGNDIIVDGSGNNTIIAGNGNDQVILTYGATMDALKDAIRKQQQALDAVIGNMRSLGAMTKAKKPGKKARLVVGTNVVRGGKGNDLIVGGRGVNDLDGGAGNDRIMGGPKADRIHGGAGNDRLVGAGGADTIWGGAGNDRISGGAGNDTLYGEAGKDVLNGGAGRDSLFGGAGNDVLQALDRAIDLVDGGTGKDRSRVDKRKDRVTAVEKTTYT